MQWKSVTVAVTLVARFLCGQLTPPFWHLYNKNRVHHISLHTVKLLAFASFDLIELALITSCICRGLLRIAAFYTINVWTRICRCLLGQSYLFSLPRPWKNANPRYSFSTSELNMPIVCARVTLVKHRNEINSLNSMRSVLNIWKLFSIYTNVRKFNCKILPVR